jgi:hypothetical protein
MTGAAGPCARSGFPAGKGARRQRDSAWSGPPAQRAEAPRRLAAHVGAAAIVAIAVLRLADADRRRTHAPGGSGHAVFCGGRRARASVHEREGQREENETLHGGRILTVSHADAAVRSAPRRPHGTGSVRLADCADRGEGRSETAQKNKRPGTFRCRVLEMIGRPCGIRTCDQRIKSPLLYQLS